MPQKTTGKKSKQKIIDILKHAGEMDATELSSRLNISAMAARQHLYALNAEGLVAYEEQPRDMGRPAKMWKLTSEANKFFPSGYADLTLTLMNSMKEAFGDQGLERILEARNQEQINVYQDLIADHSPLEDKLESLARIRTEEGYMAEVKQEADGTFLLIERHCPICAAAKACSGFCTKEMDLFQEILGKEVTIKRIEHIIDGKPRCTYRVSETDISSKKQ